jgi:hypothetical protein
MIESLTVLHPWLLAGLGAASLPVLIHLIGRRRAPIIHFAAFDFLSAVNRRLARRERLRQLLLLLLRTLAVVCLVLAVARIVPANQSAAPASQRRLALVLDASASMAFRARGTTLLERGRDIAKEVVSHLSAGDAVSLVIAGRDVRVPFQSPTLSHSAVRAAIDEVGEPAGVADLGAAIERALAQLGEDGEGATLVVITDLSKNSFASLCPTGMDPPPHVRLIDAAERTQMTPLANLAVEQLAGEQSAESPSERRFKAVVRNFGLETAQRVPIELLVDGAVTQRGYLDVPGGGSAEKTFTHTFDGPGVYRALTRLAARAPSGRADGFDPDNAVELVVEVTRGIRVLAVNGDPRTTPYEDELYFVERALEAVPKGDPPLRLHIAGPDELGNSEAQVGEPCLQGLDVVLLANVATLNAEAVACLRRFVVNGGGLLFALGNRVRFERVNEELGDLLPHPLRDVHLAHDPDAGTPALGVGDMDWDHPVLHGLGLEAEESLRASRTASYFNLDVGAGLKARTLLRFHNGAPALVERRDAGAGRVMVLTTSVDLDMSDLALRSAFPALLQRVVRYLARAAQAPRTATARVGGTVEISLPTGCSGVALRAPSGERLTQQGRPGELTRARFEGIEEVGIYEVELLRGSDWQRAPSLDVPVNPSLAESDFSPFPVDKVSQALGGGQRSAGLSVTVGTGANGDPFEAGGFAPYLLAGLCLLFVGESALASRG